MGLQSNLVSDWLESIGLIFELLSFITHSLLGKVNLDLKTKK